MPRHYQELAEDKQSDRVRWCVCQFHHFRQAQKNAVEATAITAKAAETEADSGETQSHARKAADEVS
jgi:hypothetical protein